MKMIRPLHLVLVSSVFLDGRGKYVRNTSDDTRHIGWFIFGAEDETAGNTTDATEADLDEY